MSDEARALEALKRRRSSPLGIPIVTADEPSDGTPEPTDPDAVTSPVDLLARELNEHEQEMCNRLGAARHISPQSPATISDLIKVIARVNDVKVEDRRSRRGSADRALEVLGEKGPPLERLAKVEGRMRIVWAVLITAATLATGSAVTVAKGLYEKGADEGALKIKLEHIERDAERLRIELKEVRERADRAARRNGGNGQ
jgi:hypothetical protein